MTDRTPEPSRMDVADMTNEQPSTDTDAPDDAQEYDEITLWRDYERNRVGIEVNDGGRRLLHPQFARTIADRIDDLVEHNADEIATTMRDYADEVEQAGD